MKKIKKLTFSLIVTSLLFANACSLPLADGEKVEATGFVTELEEPTGYVEELDAELDDLSQFSVGEGKIIYLIDEKGNMDPLEGFEAEQIQVYGDIVCGIDEGSRELLLYDGKTGGVETLLDVPIENLIMDNGILYFTDSYTRHMYYLDLETNEGGEYIQSTVEGPVLCRGEIIYTNPADNISYFVPTIR